MHGAYCRMRNAPTAIGNIIANFRLIMTKLCVVDSLSQHPFMVACLLNAVSLRGNTCNCTFNAIPSFFVISLTQRGLSAPTWGKKPPYMDKLMLYFSLLNLCTGFFSVQIHNFRKIITFKTKYHIWSSKEIHTIL